MIDHEIFDEVVRLAPGEDFLKRLCANFARDAEQLLHAMSEAMKARDLPHFRELTHAFKGSAINIGLRQLFELTQKMEKLSDSQLVGEGDFYLELMGAALEQAKTALTREISVSTAEGS